MNRRAFTLVEMIVATVIAGLLMGAVLTAAAGIGRDRARMTAAQNKPTGGSIIERFRWDLTNAQTMTSYPNGRALLLIGHGGIDPQTLEPNGRLARVIYTIRGERGEMNLFRSQEYLDDPIHPERWTELVSPDVSAIGVVPESGDVQTVRRKTPSQDDPMSNQRKAPAAYFVPQRVRLRVQLSGGAMIDAQLWVR